MDLTVPLMLHAHRTPNKVCLVYQEKEYTYQSLNEEVVMPMGYWHKELKRVTKLRFL